jgi:hypothetical protein
MAAIVKCESKRVFLQTSSDFRLSFKLLEIGNSVARGSEACRNKVTLSFGRQGLRQRIRLGLEVFEQNEFKDSIQLESDVQVSIALRYRSSTGAFAHPETSPCLAGDHCKLDETSVFHLCESERSPFLLRP